MFKPLRICSVIGPKLSRKLSSLLRVQFPGPYYGHPFQLSSCELKLHPSSPHRYTDHFGISLRDIVSDSNRVQVYRGTIDTPGSPNVIVKIAVNDDGAEGWVLRLEEEARMYCNELRGLQGRVVPKFFGFYTGKRERVFSRWATAPAACMILEDCGDSLTRYGAYLGNLPRFLKIEVMRNVLRLHKETGCEHRNLELENIVMHKGEVGSVRMIDFKYAQVHHHCRYGDRHARVRCSELNELEDELRIFKDGSQIDSSTNRDVDALFPRWLRLSHRHAQFLGDGKELRGRNSKILQRKFQSPWHC